MSSPHPTQQPDMNRACPHCGTLLRSGVRFCTGCGGALAAALPGASDPDTAAAQIPATVLAALGQVTERQLGDSRPSAEPPAIAAATSTPAGSAGPTGHVGRRSFFDEQTGNRRTARLWSALCAVAALVAGVPLSLALSPLVLGALVLGRAMLNRLLDRALPPVPLDRFSTLDRLLRELLALLDDSVSPRPSVHFAIADLPALLAGAALWLLPGIVLMALLWPLVRALLGRAAPGAALLSLGAREPSPADPEERQLINIVTEMALAAGMTPPRVMLLDDGSANLAAVSGAGDSVTLLVSRATLDALDRDQTAGAIAQALAGYANGDLRLARAMLAVHLTFGLMAALLRAPVSGPARRKLLRLVPLVFGRVRGDEAADRLARELGTSGILSERSDIGRLAEGDADPPRPNFLLRLAVVLPPLAAAFGLFVALPALLLAASGQDERPLHVLEWITEPGRRPLLIGVPAAIVVMAILTNLSYLAYLAARGAAWTWILMTLPYYLATMLPQVMFVAFARALLNPALAAIWRSRRYLADATAVQLTRDPDAVMRGLGALGRAQQTLAAGAWAPLFVVEPARDRPGAGGYAPAPGPFGSGGGFGRYIPPLYKRERRLLAMGALKRGTLRINRAALRADGPIWVKPLVGVLLAVAGMLMAVLAVIAAVGFVLLVVVSVLLSWLMMIGVTELANKLG